jgi:hypothetical protein
VGVVKSRAAAAAGQVSEKFSSSGGRWLGILAAGMGLVLVVGAAYEGPWKNWRLEAFGLAFALLSWAIFVRPAISAHENGLLMRNVFRDIYVPWGSIERCKALLTFQVATPEGIVHGYGVTRSTRSIMRERVGARSVFGSMFGSGTSGLFSSGPDNPSRRANEMVQSTASYVDFVEARIRTYAEGSSEPPAPIVTSPAWASIAALAAIPALVLVALLA